MTLSIWSQSDYDFRFLNEEEKNFWKIKLALRFWGEIGLASSNIITVRLLLPENGWFWQHVRMRAIKSRFICHRPISICGIEFLSFLPALNPKPEHHPIQISQTGPVHTYSILLSSSSFLLTTCSYWIYCKPHLTSFLAWHTLKHCWACCFLQVRCA